jgi:hypothetical protein
MRRRSCAVLRQTGSRFHIGSIAGRDAFPVTPRSTQFRVKRCKHHPPVFSLSALEQHQLKAVTCDMILRDLVPAAMLDRHARLVPHRFEAHVKLCRLAGCECRLTPSECEPFARLPDGDATDLELFSVRQRRDEPPAFPGSPASRARWMPTSVRALIKPRSNSARPPVW